MLVPLWRVGLFLLSSSTCFLDKMLQKHHLEICNFDDTGRGLKTLRDRPKGDVIITIHEQDAITSNSLFKKYPDLQEAAKKMAEQQTYLTDETIMAMGLLKMKRDGDHPYVSSLPSKQYSVLFLPPQLKACLPSTYVELMDGVHEYALKRYKRACEALPNFCHQDEFLWAFSTVRSRSVGTYHQQDNDLIADSILGGGQALRAILPGHDLLNHKHGSVATIGFDLDSGRYEICSTKAFVKNNQAFISYGEDRDNIKTLLGYGFCIPDNPEQVAFFNLQDLFLACQVTAPTIFTNTILTMFQNQLEQVGGETCVFPSYSDNPRSMSRVGNNNNKAALFAFDGKPRRCLENGLSVMQNLAAQLLVADNNNNNNNNNKNWNGFDKVVLDNLLSQRQGILTDCLERTKTVSIDPEWKPMLQSITTLLKEEQRLISN